MGSLNRKYVPFHAKCCRMREVRERETERPGNGREGERGGERACEPLFSVDGKDKTWV